MPAFDGGLVDNVPVEPLTSMETAGGKTLVLLTRLNKKPPSVPGCIVSVAAQGRRISRQTSMCNRTVDGLLTGGLACRLSSVQV